MDKLKGIIGYLPIIAVLLLSLFAVLPLLGGGFFPIHDNTQIQRVYEMGNALTDGMFPVRWSENLGYGYGYPVFNFYAPLFYYIGGGLTLLGLSALVATKATLIFSILLSAFSMYLLSREFWGKNGAIVSSILYVFAPFHGLNAYVRGDFAELLAYGFIPLVIWGVYRTYLSRGANRWIFSGITSLAFALIIVSHNLTALMIAPFLAAEVLVLFSLYFKKNRTLPVFVIFAPVLGVLIASFYWIPALAEMKYADVLSVVGGGSDFRDHFVCLIQFWNSPWGFAGSAPGCIDGMSFQLGKFHIAFFISSLAVLFFLRKAKEQFWALLISILLFISSFFLMTEHSRIIWETIPGMKFFQFPWRFLLLTSLATSFCAGASFWILEKRVKSLWIPIFTIILGVILVLHYQKFFSPQTINADPPEYYTNETQIKWNASRISDEYMPVGFKTPENEEDVIGEKVVIDGNAGSIDYRELKVGRLNVNLNLAKGAVVRINTAYFPAWNAYVDNEPIDLKPSRGTYSLELKTGKHELLFLYEETFIEKLSNLLSISGIGILFVGIITSLKKSHDKSS